MARIPTPALRGQEVGSVQSQFTRTPFQNLNPDAETFGAAQARTFGQLSKGLSDAADGLIKQVEDDDNRALLQIQNSSMQFTQNLVNNPVDGLLTRDKNKAVGASKDALNAYDAFALTLPTPKTPSGLSAQENYIARQKASLFQTVSSHERSQRVVVRKEEYATLIANSMQEMQTNYLNPEALQNNEKLIKDTAIRLADTSGSSKEVGAEAAQKAVSDAYSAVLYRMIGNKDIAQARALHTDLIRDGKLQPSKENTAILVALDKEEDTAAGMRLGFAAAVKYPDDPQAAAVWIREQSGSTDVIQYALTFADQQNARAQRAGSQKLRRIAQEEGKKASSAKPLNEAALAQLPGSQQAAILALQLRALNPDRLTDKNAFSAYMRLTPTERGALTEEAYVTQFYSKFDNKDQRSADTLYSAGKVKLGVEEASILRGERVQENAEQKAASTYFEKQLTDIITSLKFGNTPTQKSKKGLLEAALRAQFTTNNMNSAQSSAEIDNFLNGAMREFGNDGMYIGTLEVRGRDLPEGTLPGNLQKVPFQLRSDMALSYARSHKLKPDDDLDPKKVEAWMDQKFFVGGVNILQKAVPPVFVQNIITQIRNERRTQGLTEQLIAAPVAPSDIRKRWVLYEFNKFVGGTHSPFSEAGKPERKTGRLP
jgi:hypothetical protein